jgi:tetratricopeptide (TPR) repeat protein
LLFPAEITIFFKDKDIEMNHLKNITTGIFLIILSATVIGCSGSKKTVETKDNPNRDLALDHYLQGSMLDQKGEYAQAILEYQDALNYTKDAAIYNSIAKDYSLLGKHSLAIQMGLEAVKLQPASREYHQTLAEIYINARDLENAIKEFQEIIHIDPQYREGWINLARLQQMKNPEVSLETYQEIINRFGPQEEAYFQMAQIFGSMNMLDKSAAALRGILELEPENFEVKKALGDIYLRRDSIDAALKIYNDLAELHPDNLELRAATAHAYLVKQDYDKAKEQFDIVLQKDSLSADEQIRFGQVFVAFIERDSVVAPYAIKMFEKIQQTYPTDWRPYWFLGAISNIMKDDTAALKYFSRVMDLAKWNPDGWVSTASIYYDRNQFDEAIGILQEANKYVREEFRVYFLLGICYQRKHQTIEAASSLEKAIQLNGKSVDAMSALGLVYDEMNRPEDSDSMYERALQIDPRNHLVLNNYGYNLAVRGIQLERALKMSKEALAQQPTNQSYLDTFGWIYYQLGDYNEAEVWIRKAVELGNASSVIQEHLGDIYFKLSDKERAMIYWQKASELDPNNKSVQNKLQKRSM